MEGNKKIILCGIFLCGFIFSGCFRSPTVHHYLLKPEGQDIQPLSDKEFNLRVGPIILNSLYSSKQIFLQRKNSQIEYKNSHRWAISPNENIQWVIAQTLKQYYPNANIFEENEPMYSKNFYTLAIHYRNRGSVYPKENQTGISAYWYLLDSDDQTLAKGYREEKTDFNEGDVEDYVREQNRMLLNFTSYIAKQILPTTEKFE